MNRTAYQSEWEINEDGDVKFNTPEDFLCLTEEDVANINLELQIRRLESTPHQEEPTYG